MTNKQRIEQYIHNSDWTGLTKHLDSLSNMEFRRTEDVVRNEIMPTLDNDALWETLLHLIIYKRQAFLSCVASTEHLTKNGSLDLHAESVKALYAHLKQTNKEALVKICNMMLPLMQTETQALNLFEAWGVDNHISQLAALLKIDSELSYYMIFKTLKFIDDKLIARKVCMAIIKRGNDMAFNAACLIKEYFGLDDLPARFSLNIEQYELSHIDRDYNTFTHTLNGKRPKP